jgi:hypothetical protein
MDVMNCLFDDLKCKDVSIWYKMTNHHKWRPPMFRGCLRFLYGSMMDGLIDAVACFDVG